MRKINLVVVHCTATREDDFLSIEGLKRMHLNRGFSDVGYHYYIRRNGTIINGRNEDQIGPHVKGYNKNSMGIAYEGGLDKYGEPTDTRTEQQKRSLAALIEVVRLKYGEIPVKGHRDLSPDLDGDGVVEKHEWLKECPCFDAVEEYN